MSRCKLMTVDYADPVFEDDGDDDVGDEYADDNYQREYKDSDDDDYDYCTEIDDDDNDNVANNQFLYMTILLLLWMRSLDDHDEHSYRLTYSGHGGG